MRLLLDTHVLIWMSRAPDELSSAATELIARQSTRAFVSSINIWELRIKWNRTRAESREGLLEPMAAIAFAEQQGLELATLAPADCATSLQMRLPHRDPFDEQLLIHAQRLGAKLLTRDRQIIGHPLALGLA